jgi:hypothetical protein
MHRRRENLPEGRAHQRRSSLTLNGQVEIALGPPPNDGLTRAPLLWIAAAALSVEIPFFFFRGTPSGHDVEFHLYSWLEVLSQWRQGVFYPRWAALAQFGYGEPRFVFYPPASWTLGAILSAIVPWTIVVDIFIWIVLTAAGVSMFLLARRWLEQRDAIFAAALYVVNPYHIVIVYWRSAFAELLASSLVPLLLLLLMRTAEKESRVTLPLALLFAGAWITNAPAAVMIYYSAALLAVVLAWQRRSNMILLICGAAAVLGAALAAFYLVPAVYEQRWVNIAEAVSAGERPQDNFLFAHTADAEHDAFNRIISWIACAEIVATMIAAWGARKWEKQNPLLWCALGVWALACAILMLPISSVLWNVLPKMRFMQFPWRWMLCLGVPLVLLVTLGIRRWVWRGTLYAALLLVVILAGRRYQPPWWDAPADLREMQDNVASGRGYEGTDEYTPIGADASVIDREARRVTVQGAARAAIHVLQWQAERKVFTAEMSQPDNLVLHLFNYPAWRVEVNDRVVQAGTREETRQMLVPVQAGQNHVEIILARTWDRTAGWIISSAAILLVILLAQYRKRPL